MILIGTNRVKLVCKDCSNEISLNVWKPEVYDEKIETKEDYHIEIIPCSYCAEYRRYCKQIDKEQSK